MRMFFARREQRLEEQVSSLRQQVASERAQLDLEKERRHNAELVSAGCKAEVAELRRALADAAVREANSKEAKGMRMYQPAASMLGNSGQVNHLHHHCARMHVLRLLRLCNVYGISLGGAEALARAVCYGRGLTRASAARVCAAHGR